MRLKTLGGASVAVSEIGLGTWQYEGGVGPLRAGIARGATFIDTAERYGTEPMVGEAIRGLRDRVFLATKVRHENLRYRDVLNAADNSLRNLGVDTIDLYQIHRPNPDVPIEETMRALEQLVDAGKVRFVGVSNFSVRQLEEAQACFAHRIVSNQVRYSLVDRSAEIEMLPYCQANGLTLIAYSPLARGLEKLRAERRALAEVAAAEGRSEIQIALNWCVSRPNVIAIPRGSTVTHVEENVGASGWSLTPESLAVLDRAYAVG